MNTGETKVEKERVAAASESRETGDGATPSESWSL
eukprot:COSAG03_NODE_6480_length_1054_cov_1.420942_2_plen_34_part_01